VKKEMEFFFVEGINDVFEQALIKDPTKKAG
jgi:hypothetical protein